MKFIKLKIIVSVLLAGVITTLNGNSRLMSKPTWLYNIDEAMKLAENSGKPIMISFAGSDWCKPCILLSREVFDTAEFTSFSNENLILLLADFPRYKKNRLTENQTQHNERLAAQFNKEGIFPLVVLVNADGKMLGKAGYRDGGAEKYITHLNAILAKHR